ncbi:MAG: TonB-dependent receptor [Bacteroidales bacterium]|nr:TonB-dependent receptor [Bacteroidales bacterium]MCF8402437.1 TonB-dependent receptor [Bacteroidales bacterium]
MNFFIKYLGSFLCFFILLGVSGQDDILMKKVTLSFEEQPLKEVLHEISVQTGIDFSYNSKLVNDDQLVTLKVSDALLSSVLDQLCNSIGIEFKLVKQQIILKPQRRKNDTTKRYTISGFIRDQETGETLPGATVMIAGTDKGTISNNYGFYSLTLEEGENILDFSFVGFSKQQKVLNLTEDLKLNLSLMMDTQLLGEITIETNEQLETIEKSQMSRIKVNPQSLSAMPEFAGEVGLIKSLQSLPGIKTHSDGSAFFFVRGGNKDQNLILIDEAPVYNPAHLFGYYSVIIPEVAKDISIYKGDMPIEKGDRLSSIIDVQTKDGNLKKLEMNGVLNPFMYRFSMEGPIKKDKSSFFTSFRHSNFKWIYRQAAPDNNLYLLDVNTKINWKINSNNRIYFSFFYGADNFTNDNPGNLSGINWFNFTSTFRWNHVFNNRLFSNTTFYASNYYYKLSLGSFEWNSSINNVSLNYDMTWYPHPDYTYKFGASVTGHNFNPGNLTESEESKFVPSIAKSQADKIVFYINREHSLSDRLSYKAGLRIPIWNNKGPTIIYRYDTNYQVIDTMVFETSDAMQTIVNLDPRISLKYKLTSTASLKFSYGIYHQYIHQISNSISPFSSFEIWLPSNSNIKPQRADQLAFGYFKYFSKANIELTSEVYYKWMKNQIDYETHANLMLNPLIEGELRFGEARSYGFELLLRKTKGRFTGWVSYTYSRIFKRINGINDGREYPAYYDRPNDLSFFFSYHLTKKLNFSANWTYYTGSAITTPISFYEYNDYVVPIYGDKNNDRLPDYHRLDIALSWQLNKPERKFQHNLTLAIYNFYNKHNPVSINFNKIEKEDGGFVIPENLYGTSEILTTNKYLMGIMPSITYKFKL